MSDATLFECGARGLEDAAGKLRARGGAAAKVAPLLEEDSDFLRRIEPRRVAGRLRGQRSEPPPRGGPAPPPEPPSSDGSHRSGSRRHDLVRLAVALAAGIVVAQLISWRSYVEPRR